MSVIFKHLRTRRISVALAELTHGEGIALCKLPAGRHEFTVTEMLKRVAKGADKPRPNFVVDPLLWTVEERTMVLAHYLSHVTTDGPDFAVGPARMSSYVALDRDSKVDETELGTVIKHPLVMRPLLGVHAQALEGMCHNEDNWVAGAMACQLFKKGEASPDWAAMPEKQLQEWIATRANAIDGLPESEFDRMYEAWLEGGLRLAHFIEYSFDDDGIVCLPFNEEGGGGAVHQPARFLPDSAISTITRRLSRRPA